jgi:hypothetical protein
MRRAEVRAVIIETALVNEQVAAVALSGYFRRVRRVARNDNGLVGRAKSESIRVFPLPCGTLNAITVTRSSR